MFDLGKAEGSRAGETDPVDRRDGLRYAEEVGGGDEEGDDGDGESIAFVRAEIGTLNEVYRGGRDVWWKGFQKERGRKSDARGRLAALSCPP